MHCSFRWINWTHQSFNIKLSRVINVMVFGLGFKLQSMFWTRIPGTVYQSCCIISNSGSSSKPHFEVWFNYLSSDSLFICCVVGWIFLSHCINVTADFRNCFETRTPALWWRYGHTRLIFNQKETFNQRSTNRWLITFCTNSISLIDMESMLRWNNSPTKKDQFSFSLEPGVSD